MMEQIFLKKGKERPILQRHPWVFSGAIGQKRDIVDGQIVAVCDANGSHLGYGYYNSRSQIAVRMLSFGTEKVDKDFLANRIRMAYEKRRSNPCLKNTNAFRIIFSEGDFLPGLIVDEYNSHLVIQILTLGMEMLRNTLLELLLDILAPVSIYDRSDHPARIIEGLTPRAGQIWGLTPDEVIIHENGMVFGVDIQTGQKTGFFLDQRDNRGVIREISRDKHVLDLFCYSGGFSVAACLGGAKEVVSVDSSEKALSSVERNIALNQIQHSPIFIRGDVFKYLRRESIPSDLIIIDPPSFTKNRGAVKDACRGYKDLNLQVFQKCHKGSIVVSCSCSRFIDMDLFQKVVFSAAADSGRNVSFFKKSHQPPDHPVNIFHPESEYLKSLLLHVE
ncbi:MAG: class I SAM-dependent rRNA methyltransferase [Deltaproteobacteria bacterium]|nr:class I SAM-dependent rRNA methyltransferase [Deltaproteobacteria bacterium]